MLKRFTVATLVGALALTSLPAAPAYAGNNRNENALKLLAGLATLAIIAKAVDNDRDRKSSATVRPRPVHQAHTHQPFGQQPKNSGRPRNWAGGQLHGTITPFHTPKHVKPKRTRRWVPAQCERVIRTPKGNRHVFAGPCLQRTGFHQRLPEQCKLRVELKRRVIPAWGRKCLRRAGYHFE